MFRFLFRFAGLVVIALSFLFVVYDGTKSIADQTIYISRVASTWENIHPSSLSAVEPAVETLAGAWVWNDVIQPYFLEQRPSSVSSHIPTRPPSSVWCASIHFQSSSPVPSLHTAWHAACRYCSHSAEQRPEQHGSSIG